jgi:hypothetical protein
LAYSGNAALCFQQKSREAYHFEKVSQVLFLKFVVPRAESLLLGGPGFSPATTKLSVGGFSR